MANETIRRCSDRLKKNLRALMPDSKLASEVRSFRNENNWLATQPSVEQNRKLLVVSITEYMPQIKTESTLAKSLSFRGFHPVVAIQKRRHLANHVHETFGLTDFTSLGKFTTWRAKQAARREAERILDRDPSFKDIVDLEYQGVQIGRHALSVMVSNLRSGSVGFGDASVKKLLGKQLKRAIQCVHAADRMIDSIQPDLLLLNERGFIPHGEVFDVALNRGIPVIQFCHSHRKDALLVKRYGKTTRNIHPWSLSQESWRQVREMPWDERTDADLMHEIRGRYENGTWFDRKHLQVGKQIKSADEVREQLGLDPAKKTAVIFSHVLWDATFFYGESLFDDYEQWLVETVKVAREKRDVNWVVKLHPDYVWKMTNASAGDRPPEYAALESKVGRLPEHIRIMPPQTDIATISLFDVTDWCVTVRGTIGIEMPCFGIPVLTAGTGRYSGFGFTLDSDSREEYLDRLRKIEQISERTPNEIELARRHAFGVFRLRPIPFQSFEMQGDDAEFRLSSLGEMAEAPDLERFTNWASSTDDQDLILESPTVSISRAA